MTAHQSYFYRTGGKIMDTLIIILPVLVVLMLVIFLYLQQGKAGTAMLFGVTLPEHALTEPALKQMQSDYRKHYLIFGIVSFLATIPLFWLERYMSMALIYLLMWLIVFLYTSRLPFHKFNRQMTELKRSNKWFVGETRVVPLSPEIQRLKQAKLVSPYWFSIPVLISLALLFASIPSASSLLTITGIASLVMTGVIFVLSYTFRRMKPKVYSPSHKLNAAVNRTTSRYWSMLWLLMAIFESMNAIVAYWILTRGISSDFTLWLIGIVMVSLVPLGAILFVNHKVRMVEERLSATNGESVVVDNDAYWLGGMTYYNPDDKAIFVKKRFGSGLTVNLATTAGKWLQYGSAALALAIVIPIIAYLIFADNAAPVLQLESDGQRVTIEYLEYGTSFELSDVQELELKDSVPSGFRTNGIATSQYARGYFKLEELGASRLYIFKNSPPYIMLKLPDTYVVYNEQTEALTKAQFDQLYEKWLQLQPKPETNE
jgi:uncharacterized membrane protein